MTNTNDYSGYLEDMHAAKKKAAVAELTSAYNKNVAALDTAEKKISPVYQAARNQAAGESERSGRNFAEYAADTGLTTGAGGQAKMARTVALQNGLNDLNAREADDRADLALQRSQLESEYNAAVAKARADGNYELADALYQEAVRRDDTGYQRAYQQQMLDYQKQRDTVADSQWQNQMDYQKSRDAVADTQWQRQFDYQKDLDAAQLAAKAAQAAAEKTATKPNLTFAQMQELMETGVMGPGVLEAYRYYTGEDYKGAGYQNLLKDLMVAENRYRENAVPEKAAALIRNALNYGSITESAARELLAQYGYNV